jgi:hypothetical protein
MRVPLIIEGLWFLEPHGNMRCNEYDNMTCSVPGTSGEMRGSPPEAMYDLA